MKSFTLKRPDHWQNRGILAQFLRPISWIYRLGYFINQAITTPVTVNSRIICIGNAIAGGAGKTPVACALMQQIQQEQLAQNPCFLSKNYKGRLTGPTHVNADMCYPDVGDEALILAKIAPTIIANNRAQGVKYADEHGHDLIIMDDGYQNPSIKPDKRILILDSYTAQSNGFCLPAGPLRQPIAEAKKMADHVMYQVHLNPRNPLPDQSKPYTAFCGIGNPKKFIQTLKNSGYKVEKELLFEDHCHYTDTDMQHIADAADNTEIITTEKDWNRLPVDWQSKVSVLYVEADIPDNLAQTLLLK